jgi:hypothetical protein
MMKIPEPEDKTEDATRNMLSDHLLSKRNKKIR